MIEVEQQCFTRGMLFSDGLFLMEDGVVYE